jgi:hypothetical protein
MSEELDPSEFVQRIRQLGEQRDQQDAERVRKLEEEIIQGRSERLARRAGTPAQCVDDVCFLGRGLMLTVVCGYRTRTLSLTGQTHNTAVAALRRRYPSRRTGEGRRHAHPDHGAVITRVCPRRLPPAADGLSSSGPGGRRTEEADPERSRIGAIRHTFMAEKAAVRRG